MSNNNYADDVDVHLLVAAYSLDAVDDVERANFERHLRTCESCQCELSELSATVARIGAADESTAPPGMRDAVMASIARTPQVLPRTHMTDFAEAKRGSRAVRWLSVAAASLAIAGMGAVGYGVQQHQDVESITAEAQMVASVMMAPDAQLRQMPMGSATSTIVMSPSQGEAVMVASNVPTLPSGQVYELWTVDASGDARPAGTWSPAANGSVAVPIQGDLSTTAAVAVTVEPTGGSAKPTSKPIASVTMT